MRTFTKFDEALDFLLQEDKPCNFARVTIEIMSASVTEFTDKEILAAYNAVEPMLMLDGKIIFVAGIPMFDFGGHPL